MGISKRVTNPFKKEKIVSRFDVNDIRKVEFVGSYEDNDQEWPKVREERGRGGGVFGGDRGRGEGRREGEFDGKRGEGRRGEVFDRGRGGGEKEGCLMGDGGVKGVMHSIVESTVYL